MGRKELGARRGQVELLENRSRSRVRRKNDQEIVCRVENLKKRGIKVATQVSCFLRAEKICAEHVSRVEKDRVQAAKVPSDLTKASERGNKEELSYAMV